MQNFYRVKSILITLNALLFIAVGFLYYRNFSETKEEGDNNKQKHDSTAIIPPVVPVANIASLPKGAPIVFINSDSLFEKYEYAQKARASGEGKIEYARKNYQAKFEALQRDYADYIEKAKKGTYSQEEGLRIEAELKNRYDELIMMEQNQDKILDALDNANMDVMKKIYDFMARFNKKHGYVCALAYTHTGGGVLGINDSLDVTRQVIEGLNAEYNATNRKQK